MQKNSANYTIDYIDNFSLQRKRVSKIIKILEQEYPQAKISLVYKGRFQLLVATMLSAQCSDAQVNKVTKRLFSQYKTVKDFAEAKLEDLEKIIRSTGFYHNKAKNIIKTARIILDRFQGRVPNNMQELINLPGVARKTANIVLFNGFGKLDGIAVDTHVKRLSNRLGLTNNLQPEKIEKDLMKIVPKDYWGKITNLLIEHGRNVCLARFPQCAKCKLELLCPSAN